MRRRIRLDISAGAILLLALMVFFDTEGLVGAVLPAVAAHELGHYLALRACGRRLTRLRVGLAGLEMDYAPRLEGARSALCAAAGPIFGGLYALAACAVGRDFWQISGAASFLLTAFNLLPILPLDGGRLLSAALRERDTRRVSRVASLALLVCGAAVLLAFRSAALMLAGLWLVFCNFRA